MYNKQWVSRVRLGHFSHYHATAPCTGANYMYSKKVAHVAVARKKMVWPQWRKKIARIRSISEPIFAFQSKFSNILIFILGH